MNAVVAGIPLATHGLLQSRLQARDLTWFRCAIVSHEDLCRETCISRSSTSITSSLSHSDAASLLDCPALSRKLKSTLSFLGPLLEEGKDDGKDQSFLIV